MLDTDACLCRLGVPHPGTPSVESLLALQRAHVEVVPYESLDIQIGRPTSIDPAASAQRIIDGRGGYCFHMNGALALLLETLGYQVTRHVGGVFSRHEPVAISGGHLALTVDQAGVHPHKLDISDLYARSFCRSGSLGFVRAPEPHPASGTR